MQHYIHRLILETSQELHKWVSFRCQLLQVSSINSDLVTWMCFFVAMFVALYHGIHHHHLGLYTFSRLKDAKAM